MAEEQGGEPEWLAHLSVHNPGRTFGTRFCENGTDLKITRGMLNHAAIQTAMDRYNEAAKAKRECSANVEG